MALLLRPDEGAKTLNHGLFSEQRLGDADGPWRVGICQLPQAVAVLMLVALRGAALLHNRASDARLRLRIVQVEPFEPLD